MPEDKKKTTKPIDSTQGKPELHKKDMPDTIDLPKKSQAAKVWMIVAILAIIALIGLGIYGYMRSMILVARRRRLKMPRPLLQVLWPTPQPRPSQTSQPMLNRLLKLLLTIMKLGLAKQSTKILG
jgi:hypothetical protein